MRWMRERVRNVGGDDRCQDYQPCAQSKQQIEYSILTLCGLLWMDMVVLKYGSFKMFEAIWNVKHFFLFTVQRYECAILHCVLWILRQQQFAVHQMRVKDLHSRWKTPVNQCSVPCSLHWSIRWIPETQMEREWKSKTRHWPFPMPTICNENALHENIEIMIV